jgi:DNA-binding transcriptional regulator YiaG
MMNKPYQYRECGLDYIYLCNGYTQHDTPYGKGVSIASADRLHQAIARHIVSSARPICGQEVRFIRSILDASQEGLAEILGVTRVTIARWEKNPNKPIKDMAARAVRWTYTEHATEGDNSLIRQAIEKRKKREDSLQGKKRLSKTRIILTQTGKSWSEAA